MSKGEADAITLFIVLALMNLGYYSRDNLVAYVAAFALLIIGLGHLEVPK